MAALTDLRLLRAMKMPIVFLLHLELSPVSAKMAMLVTARHVSQLIAVQTTVTTVQSMPNVTTPPLESSTVLVTTVTVEMVHLVRPSMCAMQTMVTAMSTLIAITPVLANAHVAASPTSKAMEKSVLLSMYAGLLRMAIAM